MMEECLRSDDEESVVFEDGEESDESGKENFDNIEILLSNNM